MEICLVDSNKSITFAHDDKPQKRLVARLRCGLSCAQMVASEHSSSGCSLLQNVELIVKKK